MTRQPDLNRAASMAYRLLIRAQTRTLPVDPLALLRRCRNTKVCTYLEAADLLGLPEQDLMRRLGPAEAITLRQDSAEEPQYLVIYQSEGNPARLRFTLAHELGHRVLAHQGNDLAEEREADCFASHLLCPRPVIARLAARFHPLYVEQVASICYVSPACARNLSPVDGLPAALLNEIDTLFQDAAENACPVAAQRNLHQCRTIKCF